MARLANVLTAFAIVAASGHARADDSLPPTPDALVSIDPPPDRGESSPLAFTPSAVVGDVATHPTATTPQRAAPPPALRDGPQRDGRYVISFLLATVFLGFTTVAIVQCANDGDWGAGMVPIVSGGLLGGMSLAGGIDIVIANARHRRARFAMAISPAERGATLGITARF